MRRRACCTGPALIRESHSPQGARWPFVFDQTRIAIVRQAERNAALLPLADFGHHIAHAAQKHRTLYLNGSDGVRAERDSAHALSRATTQGVEGRSRRVEALPEGARR